MRTSGMAFCTLAIAICTAVAARATAEDHFLTIGGGYSPTHNQVSLEKNVQFFQRLLAEQKPDGAAHEILFSDGAAPERDVQFADPANAAPAANQRMARLFGNRQELGLAYRNHEVRGVRGASTRASLEAWFQDVGAKLKAGDRLLIYVTAHGGKSKDKQRPHNTRLHLWNDEDLPVADLAAQLDKIAPQVAVVVVMVQCYGGGFSHLLFRNANAAEGLAAQNRCGFFATSHERPAAGCTPDIRAEDYQEYSSYFLAALGGKERLGQALAAPDYNGDGRVSFDEAHAFAQLASMTIDIPLRTSDAFLRTYSKSADATRSDLVTAEAPYAELIRNATPAERAVLAGLARQLDLPADNPVPAAKKSADLLEEQRRKLGQELDAKEAQAKVLARGIQRDLKRRWPELVNLLNPQSIELVTTRAGEFIAAVDAHPNYSELTRLDAEAEQLRTRRLDLERQWARCQRLVQTAERVALAANLSKVATPELLNRYEQLLAAERGSLQE